MEAASMKAVQKHESGQIRKETDRLGNEIDLAHNRLSDLESRVGIVLRQDDDVTEALMAGSTSAQSAYAEELGRLGDAVERLNSRLADITSRVDI